MKVRVGNGYDFHRLESGTTITLAGVKMESQHSIVAHSDGDIILHAIVDAILGALSMPDIGTYFPDTDSKWENASSIIFLNKALELMKQRNFEISNIDITMVCEVPKIKPIRDILIQNLVKILGTQEGCVSLKATTVEQMGAIGRREGIACFASVCLISN